MPISPIFALATATGLLVGAPLVALAAPPAKALPLMVSGAEDGFDPSRTCLGFRPDGQVVYVLHDLRDTDHGGHIVDTVRRIAVLGHDLATGKVTFRLGIAHEVDPIEAPDDETHEEFSRLDPDDDEESAHPFHRAGRKLARKVGAINKLIRRKRLVTCQRPVKPADRGWQRAWDPLHPKLDEDPFEEAGGGFLGVVDTGARAAGFVAMRDELRVQLSGERPYTATLLEPYENESAGEFEYTGGPAIYFAPGGAYALVLPGAFDARSVPIPPASPAPTAAGSLDLRHAALRHRDAAWCQAWSEARGELLCVEPAARGARAIWSAVTLKTAGASRAHARLVWASAAPARQSARHIKAFTKAARAPDVVAPPVLWRHTAGAPAAVAPGLTFGPDGDEHLALKAGDKVIRRLVVGGEEEGEPVDASVTVYRAGPHHLAVAATLHHHWRARRDASVTLWRLPADPAAFDPARLPSPPEAACDDDEAQCPVGQRYVRHYLDRFCRQALTDDDYRALGDLGVAGRLSSADLAYLHNAFGALYGHAFKRRKALNAYYYGRAGKRLLPKACRERFASFADAKAIPAWYAHARQRLLTLYRQGY